MANTKYDKTTCLFLSHYDQKLWSTKFNFDGLPDEERLQKKAEIFHSQFEQWKLFDLCWKQIPQSLVKKLNSNELLEYINLHILPKVVAEQKSVLTSVIPKAYLNQNSKKHTMEVFA